MRIVFLVFWIGIFVVPVMAEQKPPQNAANIYRKAFELYQTEGQKWTQEVLDELEAKKKSRTSESEPNLQDFRMHVAELRERTAWQIEEKITDFASGYGQLDREIEEYVSSHRDVINLVWQAAAIPECNWDLNSRDPYDPVYITELSRKNTALRDLHYLVVADIRIEEEKGNSVHAIHQTIEFFKIACHVGNQEVIDFLTAMGFVSKNMSCLQRQLGRISPDPQLLGWLSERLDQENKRIPSLKDCLQNENISFNKEAFKDLFKLYDPNSTFTVSDEYLNRSRLYHDAFRKRLIHAVFLSYPQAIVQLEKLYAGLQRDTGDIWKGPDRKTLDLDKAYQSDALLTQVAEGNRIQVFKISVTTQNQFNALCTAVKVYLAYARAGQLPDKLPAGCPADLFTTKPFAYETTSDGFMLRSAGKSSAPDDDFKYEYKLTK